MRKTVKSGPSAETQQLTARIVVALLLAIVVFRLVFITAPTHPAVADGHGPAKPVVASVPTASAAKGAAPAAAAPALKRQPALDTRTVKVLPDPVTVLVDARAPASPKAVTPAASATTAAPGTGGPAAAQAPPAAPAPASAAPVAPSTSVSKPEAPAQPDAADGTVTAAAADAEAVADEAIASALADQLAGGDVAAGAAGASDADVEG